MQDSSPKSSASATETLDGFSFAKWVIDEHQKNGDPVAELLRAAKDHETDWLEKKAAVYPSPEHDDDYSELLKETPPKKLERAKKLYRNEIHKEIVAAVIALRHSRGGVVLIGIDDNNNPVPLREKSSEQPPQKRGLEMDSFGRTEVLGEVFGKNVFECRVRKKKKNNEEEKDEEETETWTWTLPSSDDLFQIRQLQFHDNPVLALLVPPLPPESRDFLIADVKVVEVSKNGKKLKTKKVLLRRMPGDAVGQTKRKTIGDDWIENETKLGDFIRKRKELFFDNGDLARLRQDLSRVIFSSFDGRSEDTTFVGRDNELNRLNDLLSKGKIPVVTGDGGTGKTELVVQYAKRHKADYRGGLFLIDMETAKNWDDVLRRLLDTPGGNMRERLGFSQGEKGDEKRHPSSAEIAGALARLAERDPVLLVLDNVEVVGNFFGESFFERKAALTSDVRTVVTARKSNVWFDANNRCVVLPLDDLDAKAARELLLSRRSADSDAERKAAESIVESLGRRALYLCRIRALLTVGDENGIAFACSYADLETKLRESKRRLEMVGAAMEKTQDQDRTPEALWNLTREALSKNQAFGAAWIKLAHIASFFSPDGFQKHILRHLWGVMATPKANTESAFEQAIKVLRWHWLLSGEGNILRMHRLNADAIRQSALKDDSDIEERIGKTLASYPGMSPKEWLTLVDSAAILAFVPETARRDQPRDGTTSLQARLLFRNPDFEKTCRWEWFDGQDWAWLLAEQPQFADRCQWEKLDGFDWADLLESRPHFADHCPWEELGEYAWARILESQPQFADRCPWEKLDESSWVNLLSKQPQFADRCPWNKLDGLAWACLLQFQPQFAERCPWEKLNGFDWACLLEFQPQFSDRCPWEKLDGFAWCWLLAAQPQFADHCPWEKLEELDGSRWADLLRSRPQFADRCPWEKLDGFDWTCLLDFQPQFADRCPWEKLDEFAWAYLLRSQPQFADRYPWEKLDESDWARLLGFKRQLADRCPSDKLGSADWVRLLRSQPQLADYCPWEKLDGSDWSRLLRNQPQLAERCPWEKLDGSDWASLLKFQPQLVDCCPLEKLDGSDWGWLLASQPQIADRCPWEKLDGFAWARLLEKQPRFSAHCSWEKLDGSNWADLLHEQPQFADRCTWEKLNGHNWAVLLCGRFIPKEPPLDQFVDCCPWDKLDGHDWATLLCEQPQFGNRCSWEKLDGCDWVDLLRGPLFSRDPPPEQFVCRCPWEKLDGHDWTYLLGGDCQRGLESGSPQPQFGERCSWNKLDGEDWVSLLVNKPQFAEHCHWEKLDEKDWERLLGKQPQFANNRPRNE